MCATSYPRDEGIEVRLVKRREYSEEAVRWADAVIAAGGNCSLRISAGMWGFCERYQQVPGV